MVKLPSKEALKLPRSRSHHRWGSRLTTTRFEALRRDPVPRSPADLVEQIARCLTLMRKFTDNPDVQMVIALMRDQYHEDQEFQALCHQVFGQRQPEHHVEHPDR